MPGWTDVDFAAARLWIIMLSVSPLAILSTHSSVRGTVSTVAQTGFSCKKSLFVWVFFNQPSSWRHRWTPTAGISWSRFSCLVRVTRHPVSWTSLLSIFYNVPLSISSFLLPHKYIFWLIAFYLLVICERVYMNYKTRKIINPHNQPYFSHNPVSGTLWRDLLKWYLVLCVSYGQLCF